jgi:hypothetical protein
MEPTPGIVHFDVPHGSPEAHAELMERLGHPASVCHGPEDDVCPILVEEGSCPLIEDAHGVVFEFDLDDQQHRDILARYLEVIDDEIPLRVIAAPEVADRHRDLLRGVDVWTHEPSVGELDGFAALVEAADDAAEQEAGA